MKTNSKYLDLYELMNQKLLKQEQAVISCLSMVLCQKSELDFKDDSEMEERMSDEAIDRIGNLQEILYPLLDSVNDDTLLQEILFSSGIFSESSISDIITIYDYRRESKEVRLPLFDISSDKETFLDNSLLFLQRSVSSCRVRCFLEEILSGMETYGTACYQVDDEAEGFSLLEPEDGSLLLSPEEMKPEDLVKELMIELMPHDDDSDEEREEKTSCLALIAQIGKYRGTTK